MFALFSCLFIAALWSPAGKDSFVCDVYCVFVTYPCGVLGQVWCLIVSIPDLCLLSYFKCIHCVQRGVLAKGRIHLLIGLVAYAMRIKRMKTHVRYVLQSTFFLKRQCLSL